MVSPVRATRAYPTVPNALYVLVDGVTEDMTRPLAETAVRLAMARAPKLSGASANRIRPYWGQGFFGLRWTDQYLWFQERGTRPFTMRKLSGKVIPMWVDDPAGKLAADSPRAKTRTTRAGRKQILIFRRAAPIGQRKTVRRKIRGTYMEVDVPASYPGAPGRISGRLGGGTIIPGNTGVRWRHPGLTARGFLQRSVLDVARSAGFGEPPVYLQQLDWE